MFAEGPVFLWEGEAARWGFLRVVSRGGWWPFSVWGLVQVAFWTHQQQREGPLAPPVSRGAEGMADG